MRVGRAGEQVALPLARDGAVLGLRRALADRDRVRDTAAACPLRLALFDWRMVRFVRRSVVSSLASTRWAWT